MNFANSRRDSGAPFSDLVGATIHRIAFVDRDEVYIETDRGVFGLYYEPDCCGDCYLVDVIGDPAEITGAVVHVAEERSNRDDPPDERADSWTWTFYEIRTDKGDLTLRWLGESNGYYSESVDFVRAQAVPETAGPWKVTP